MSEAVEPIYLYKGLDGSIEERQSKYFSVEEKLYLHMGFFINCYAVAETAITILMMSCLGINNSSDMSIIAQRVSAPDKIGKLKSLLQNRNCTIDPGLWKLFGHFMGPITKLRNVIAHDLTISHEDTDMGILDISTFKDPIHKVPLVDIFQHAEWTKIFAQVLVEVAKDLHAKQLSPGGPDTVLGFDEYPLSVPVKPTTPPAPGKPSAPRQ